MADVCLDMTGLCELGLLGGETDGHYQPGVSVIDKPLESEVHSERGTEPLHTNPRAE